MNGSIERFFSENRGKVIGGLIGLLVALIITLFGFWKGIFIIISVLAGVYIGGRLEKNDELRSLLSRFWYQREKF